MTAPRNRDGFALLMALLAISIMAALMLATLLRVDQNAQVAHAETLTQRALTRAETALWEAATNIDIRQLRAEPPGAITVSETTPAEPTLKVIVTKIDTAVIWIVVDATVQSGRDLAHHRLGLSATLKADTTDMRLYPIPDRGLVELF